MSTQSGPLAAALDALLESGRPDRVEPLLAPGAVLWHNDDKAEMRAADAIRRVEGLHHLVDGLRVDVVQHEDFPGGFLHRIALRGHVRATGEALLVHNCIVVQVDDSRITRIDEYIDPTFGAQLGLPDGHSTDPE